MEASLTLLLGLGAFAALSAAGAFILIRLRRHLQRNLENAVGQQLGLSRRMTEIIIQLQENQKKQDEQLQKLAEFSLRLKREMKIVADRQANLETDLPVKADDKPRYLN